MPTSVRVAVVLVVLGTWCCVIADYLFQGKLPDVMLLGVPAAVLLAASPLPSKLRPTPKKRSPAKRVPRDPAEEDE